MDDEGRLVEALRAGDEAAFVELLQRYQTRLLRIAQAIVGGRRAVAEEVCQDTWLAVVRGIDRFEGRASFTTWLFRVLVNRARSAAGREQRAGRPEDDLEGCFESHGRWKGHWRDDLPEAWADDIDDHMVAHDLAERVIALLPQLPAAQRQVVVLRDIEHLDAPVVASMLGISEGNERVLLHRGRVRLRTLLTAQMGGAA